MMALYNFFVQYMSPAEAWWFTWSAAALLVGLVLGIATKIMEWFDEDDY